MMTIVTVSRLSQTEQARAIRVSCVGSVDDPTVSLVRATVDRENFKSSAGSQEAVTIRSLRSVQDAILFRR
jgi:hypothetical protein